MKIFSWLADIFRLPTTEELLAELMIVMEPSKKLRPLESYENSLRWSLREAIGLLPERKVRFGIFYCQAPLQELEGVAMPKELDLLMDFEFEMEEWTRIYFDLEFLHIARDENDGLHAVYRAASDC